RAREANRIQKVLETANSKLASVVTTVLGVSARAMIKALIAGVGTPEQVADLAQRSLRRQRAALAEALTGHVTAPHRFLLDHVLRHIEFLDDAIAACDRQIATLSCAMSGAGVMAGCSCGGSPPDSTRRAAASAASVVMPPSPPSSAPSIARRWTAGRRSRRRPFTRAAAQARSTANGTSPWPSCCGRSRCGSERRCR